MEVPRVHRPPRETWPYQGLMKGSFNKPFFPMALLRVCVCGIEGGTWGVPLIPSLATITQ